MNCWGGHASLSSRTMVGGVLGGGISPGSPGGGGGEKRCSIDIGLHQVRERLLHAAEVHQSADQQHNSCYKRGHEQQTGRGANAE